MNSEGARQRSGGRARLANYFRTFRCAGSVEIEFEGLHGLVIVAVVIMPSLAEWGPRWRDCRTAPSSCRAPTGGHMGLANWSSCRLVPRHCSSHPPNNSSPLYWACTAHIMTTTMYQCYCCNVCLVAFHLLCAAYRLHSSQSQFSRLHLYFLHPCLEHLTQGHVTAFKCSSKLSNDSISIGKKVQLQITIILGIKALHLTF